MRHAIAVPSRIGTQLFHGPTHSNILDDSDPERTVDRPPWPGLALTSEASCSVAKTTCAYANSQVVHIEIEALTAGFFCRDVREQLFKGRPMGLARSAPGVVLVEFVEHESRQECLLVFRELANAGDSVF